MNKKEQVEKQTVIKLLNKYADSYHFLENKIEILTKENKDLKYNIQINKEIIQNFFQGTTIEQKISTFINKTKKENSNLTNKIKYLEIELDRSQKENNFIKYIKEENSQLKTKIFIIENLLQEKENELLRLTNRTPQNAEKKNNYNSKKNFEIYIASPSKVINKLNDQLETLRDINSKFARHIKSVEVALSHKEKIIQDYELQIAKYKEELANYKHMKSNTTIISQLNKFKLSIGNTRIRTPTRRKSSNTTNEAYSPNLLSTPNEHTRRTKLINQIEKLEKVNENKKQITKKEFDLNKEWYDTLKYCGTTQEEYISFCNSKEFEKLIDVIEYLYKLLIDKNIHIKLLSEENDRLNAENLKLNKCNIELNEEIDNYKNCCNLEIKKFGNNEGSTFVNVENSFHNIDSNVNLNLMMDYLNEVHQSISSREFKEGMVIDRFDLESEMSEENIKGSNGGDFSD